MEHSCIWNFTPIKPEPILPKTWEEFCAMTPIRETDAFISNNSDILSFVGPWLEARDPVSNSNLLPDITGAEAILALCQLIQLRDCYNGGYWVPDWNDYLEKKYIIEFYRDRLEATYTTTYPRSILYFKSEKLRNMFLSNFKYLIKKTAPLFGVR